MKKILMALLIFFVGLALVISSTHGAEHRLSDFKKIYPTIYLFPRDVDMLKAKTSEFILLRDPHSEFVQNGKTKAYLKAFDKLKNKLQEKGFVLTARPEDADAIAAFRAQIGLYDLIGGYMCHTTSLRIIDIETKDTLLILTTAEPSLVTRNIDGETDKLIQLIGRNL